MAVIAPLTPADDARLRHPSARAYRSAPGSPPRRDAGETLGWRSGARQPDSGRLFLARVASDEQPRRVSFPDAVVLDRDLVFDIASAAHSVSSSLRGLGFRDQEILLDGVVDKLEARLLACGRA